MSNEQIIKKFPSHSTWYYITKNGIVNSFTVHSGISPHSAYTLSKVFVVYKTFIAANKALEEFNSVFNTFKNN